MTTAPLAFGLSTHLFHGERLDPQHLERIAAHGFRLVELFATRTHLDYRDGAAVDAVRRALDATGLTPWSMHAPICESFTGGVWGRAYSNATNDPAGRREAVEETRAAVRAAREIGCSVLVLHLGLPHGQPIPPNDNDRAAARRSLEDIAAACAEAGVRLALEVIPNDLSAPAELRAWLEGDLELDGVGVCLDVGHAHLIGSTPEAAEILSGHVITTHVHDNTGRSDDHLLPFDGTIDWPGTLVALFKIGYTGPLVFELPDHGDAGRVLQRAAAVRTRLQRIVDELKEPLGFEER